MNDPAVLFSLETELCPNWSAGSWTVQPRSDHFPDYRSLWDPPRTVELCRRPTVRYLSVFVLASFTFFHLLLTAELAGATFSGLLPHYKLGFVVCEEWVFLHIDCTKLPSRLSPTVLSPRVPSGFKLWGAFPLPRIINIYLFHFVLNLLSSLNGRQHYMSF